MNIFYLISIILSVSAQNVLKKAFGQRVGSKGIYFFTSLSCVGALAFFAATSNGFSWNPDITSYSIFFAIFYAIAILSGTAAIACGSLSLTSLVTSYSLMVPTLYGLVFLNDPISIGLIPGLVLLVISLVLINKKSDNSPYSFKWLIYVTLSFICNGMCSVVQKMQQIEFDGAYKNEFMIAALFMVALFTAIISLKSERKDLKQYFKCGWHFALICGAANGAANLFVMILSGLIPISLMFPLVSAGGIIVTYIISKLYYKEVLSKSRLVGFILGVGSVVLLSI